MTDVNHEIWVLSRGSYSSYRVMCACASKKDAETLAARYNADGGYDEAFVESILMVASDVSKVEVLHLHAELWDNGQETKHDPRVEVQWPFDDHTGLAATPVFWRWVRAPVHGGAGGRLEVGGTDHERVRKVFSDMRAEILADETGQIRKAKERKGRR